MPTGVAVAFSAGSILAAFLLGQYLYWTYPGGQPWLFYALQVLMGGLFLLAWLPWVIRDIKAGRSLSLKKWAIVFGIAWGGEMLLAWLN